MTPGKPAAPTPTEADFAQAGRTISDLRLALGQVIVGQDALIQGLICAVLAGGHVLLEGLPGLGKTHLVKALASALGLSLARVQCTPDLMPSDMTGSEVMVAQGTDGHQALGFRPGPIFANLVLVDEVNRATPKTQSALLEAMQEGQVTQGGTRHPLPAPFWVVATQNPIEIEGTYPLPEAQLDRFLVKLQVEIPDAQGLLAMLEVSLDDEPADHLGAVLDLDAVNRLMDLARAVVVAPPLKHAAVDLVLATHPAPGRVGAASKLRYGASPRALQALLRTARVLALMAGRAHLSPADLEAAALPCLRHRILLGIDAELAGERPDDLLGEILDGWRTRIDPTWTLMDPNLAHLTQLDEPRLERMALHAARLLAGRPLHLGGQRPHPRAVPAGLEFHEHRPLSAGDDPRHIDWRASARAREPQVRRYRDERAARWVLCLDRSASMGPCAPGVWPLALALTGALAYVLIALEHQVGLALYSTGLDRVLPPGRGRGAYLALRRVLAGASPMSAGGGSDPGSCLPLTDGASLALVSDFLAPDAMFPALARLNARAPGLQALQVVGAAAPAQQGAGPITVVDAESGERLVTETSAAAVTALAARQEALVLDLGQRCRRQGMVHSVSRVGTPWDLALLAHLDQRRPALVPGHA